MAMSIQGKETERTEISADQYFMSIPFLMLTKIDRIIIPEMNVGCSKGMHIYYFLYYMMIIYAVLRR